jgi:hypothetical protein
MERLEVQQAMSDLAPGSGTQVYHFPFPREVYGSFSDAVSAFALMNYSIWGSLHLSQVTLQEIQASQHPLQSYTRTIVSMNALCTRYYIQDVNTLPSLMACAWNNFQQLNA